MLLLYLQPKFYWDTEICFCVLALPSSMAIPYLESRERKHAVWWGLTSPWAGSCTSDHSRSFLLLFPPAAHPILIISRILTLSSDYLPDLQALCHMKLFFHSI